MLLMALPNEHQLTFNQYKDAKTLFEAIQTRFGGNDATKKTQKTLLKQMYENFNAPSTESLDSISNRLQKIVSQNKLNLDTISFDDLYNNFKIVEQEVKRTVTSSLNSSSQNMAFVSTPSSTNEVNTTNVQVSTASTPVSTASTPASTGNLSNDTVYAFLASQPNGSQLVYEDLEQIHDGDLEEMDLKWQLALLSMRARRFYQRIGKRITINGSDTAGYDKSKVECFNYHKMGHFARECKGPRNQDNRNRNQDNSKRTMNVEETSSKAMMAIDGAGFDWSFMADEEVLTNTALMAFSDSEVYNDKTCSNTCLKSFETLKTQYDNLRIELNKFEFDLVTYKRGLASVEEQLVFYKKNEVMLCDQIIVLKRDITYKDSDLSLFAPPTIDLSNSGLKEFQQPEFERYRFKTNKSVCENSSNEIKKTTDAPIIKDWVSDCNEDEAEVMVLKSDNVQHKPEQANQPKKGNRVTSVVGEQEINVVKSSACWVWRPKIKADLSLELKVLVVHHTTHGHQFTMSNGQERIGYSRANDNWYALTANPTIYVSLIQQFWQTVTIDTVNDGEQQLTIIVDGQTIAITEASVRRHLQLADADGISSLPNTEIFDQLTLMGYVSNDDKLTFQKGGHTHGSDEGSKKLNELIELCTKLSDKVTSLEDDLKQTKKLYGKALTKLVKKVKQLEAKLKSTTERRKARMVISDDEEDLISKDTSKQGRMTETEYEEVEIDLNQTDDDLQWRSIIEEIDLGVLSAAKILADASKERAKTYTRRRRSNDSLRDSTARGLFSTSEEAQGKDQISTDEKVAHKLNDEEMARAATRKEQERIDLEKALEQSDSIRRYQTLKKKPVLVAQARKNMMIYLKNMAGYKMNYFKGMSYDMIRPIFDQEYNKVQTLFTKDIEVEKTKTKRVAEETLLQESFKKLRIAEALREDLVTLWSLVKERFRSTKPIEDKERALWVELKRLFELDKDDVLWKLQRYIGDFSSNSFIILEAVASQDFLDRHVFYGDFGANNKINVICQSPLFSDLKAGKAQEEVEFQANKVTYKWGYYLVNEIYMEWDTLFKSTSHLSAGDTKRIRYKLAHEAQQAKMWKERLAC
ncbi:putative ribonuclease H-like domain-containing protein [Tanacetum coccineum]|uniref:Ribonuclease H-like domain-containing protein n=1 Tax=Tanacetum coccineum TaxID=301880 RepID=A0ABQ4YVB7_9ASTR